jgi:hypothetical protein
MRLRRIESIITQSTALLQLITATILSHPTISSTLISSKAAAAAASLIRSKTGVLLLPVERFVVVHGV